MIKESDLALVADRKPGRPKTKTDESQAEQVAETKPAKKRAANKAKA